MEELAHKSTCDIKYLGHPKLEALDESEMTFEYEANKEVILTVGLPSIIPHLNSYDVNEQNVEMVMPIKTELNFNNDIVKLLRLSKESEHGNVSEYDIKRPVAEFAVCMICLDTDSKLFLMSKCKLGEAYEKLSGHPLCNQRNLKRTVCIRCAQRLIKFSAFREKCLRARGLMMDLVKQHEVITKEHIKKINRTKSQLMDNLVVSKLGADHCDLYILEEPSDDIQTEPEATVHRVVVKQERSDDSMLVDDRVVINDEYYIEVDVNDEFVKAPLKYESAPFQCIPCSEEFVHEHVYMHHRHTYLQAGAIAGECGMSQVCEPHTVASSSSEQGPLRLVAPLSARLPRKSRHKMQAEEVRTIQNRKQVSKIEYDRSDSHTSSIRDKDRTTNSAVKLYNVLEVPNQDLPVSTGSCDSQCNIDTAPKYFKYQLLSQNEDIGQVTTELKVKKRKVSKSLRNKRNRFNNVTDQTNIITGKSFFICDVCSKNFKRKKYLVNHLKVHSGLKPYTCYLCNFKTGRNDHLVGHMKTHFGEKPHSCELCQFKCVRKNDLVRHKRIHTGEKPHSCKLCLYRCVRKHDLVVHMRTHTGEKPYSCALCDYKCAISRSLLIHMRTHSGEKPFSCNLCHYKSARNDRLIRHMKTHTGEKL